MMQRIHPGLPLSDIRERALVDAWLAGDGALAAHRVLDAGCGFQHGLIVQYRDRLRAVGIDIDPGVVRKNKDVEAKAVADCGAIPLRSGCVDLVFCRFVLEHLSDPRAAIGEFVRVLKPGGAALISTVNVRNPAMWSIRFVPRWVRTVVRSASFGQELGENAPTYYRANTEAQIRSLLEEAGFVSSSCYYYPAFVWYFRFATPLLLLFTWINRGLDALGLNRYYGGILVAAAKPAAGDRR